MIPADILGKLPPPARQKLLLLDGMSDEQLARSDGASSALQRLSDQARRGYFGAEENPSVARLGAVVDDADRRREDLHRLIGGCVQWVRSIPEHALPLEVVAAEPPSLKDGETPEAAVMKVRADLGELMVERLEVQQLPEPKPIIMASFKREVERLAASAKPRLDFTRGRARPVFQPADIIGPEFVAGLIAWAIGPDKMAERLDALVEAEIDGVAAMASDEQAAELRRLDDAIEALGRAEEALISLAFDQGVDVLRRANADPACVLGVRAPKPAARPMRRPRLGRPVAEAAE